MDLGRRYHSSGGFLPLILGIAFLCVVGAVLASRSTGPEPRVRERIASPPSIEKQHSPRPIFVTTSDPGMASTPPSRGYSRTRGFHRSQGSVVFARPDTPPRGHQRCSLGGGIGTHLDEVGCVALVIPCPSSREGKPRATLSVIDSLPFSKAGGENHHLIELRYPGFPGNPRKSGGRLYLQRAFERNPSERH